MAKQTINLGTSANDRTGTNLRAAFDICNDNFSELYDVCSVDGTVKVKYAQGTFIDKPKIVDIETLTGVTATTADTGCIFIISSDAGILYFVTSDGGNWYVIEGTKITK